MALHLTDIARFLERGYSVGFHSDGSVASLTAPGEQPPAVIYQACNGKRPKSKKAEGELKLITEAPPADPRHAEFIQAFTDAWSEHMEGETYDMSNCGRDTKALSLFLKRCDKPVAELMKGVTWAWSVLAKDGQHAAGCVKACMTIHGFVENYNALRTFYASYKEKAR